MIIISIKVHEKYFNTKTDKIELKDRDGKRRAPNILLFNCHYGAGHKMATQGITESLPECDIHVVDIYAEPLRPLDPMRDFIPKWSNETLYNNMAKKEQNQLLNFVGNLGPKIFFLQRLKIEKLLMEYIVKESPDMIISCIPLVNPMLFSICKQLGIPFLVVTTDIDISAFCYGFEDNYTPIDKNQFRITVPFSKETWDQKFSKFLPKEIKNSLQYCFGYPTRQAFSKNIKNKVLEELRKDYQIQRDENVILVMMGGNAAKAAKIYATLLLKMTDDEIKKIVGQKNKRDKIRMICLCGDISQRANQDFMDQLNILNSMKGKHNNRVHIHACPGSPKIAELVSLPELCTVISKPGGSTVNEMIKKKVPMVYHISKVPLDWEKGNMEYGVNQGLGKSFKINDTANTDMQKDLVDVLSGTFFINQEIQEGRKTVPESKFIFTDNLRSTVKEMLLIDSQSQSHLLRINN